MATIQSELGTLSNTVITPIYSWVNSFQNFIKTDGQWVDACSSRDAEFLDFNAQVRMFVQIKVESDCCQRYGICGEQYVTDIQFDDSGVVKATRFRFQHKPEFY
jgi:Niemann-Pick C1 protein